ncbi:helix-turn-helix domain-containing protein [uncultured Clostridium sp.]|uniref:helix-turn-helix domain-containing protein n=1 Tax=uncultured Clostridium sp. TaxID=59620 RepID=UPI0037DD986C
MNDIKNIRQQQGLTIKVLSKKSKVAGSYLSNLENGISSNPSMETMIKISTALGKSVPEVFFPEQINKEVC